MNYNLHLDPEGTEPGIQQALIFVEYMNEWVNKESDLEGFSIFSNELGLPKEDSSQIYHAPHKYPIHKSIVCPHTISPRVLDNAQLLLKKSDSKSEIKLSDSFPLPSEQSIHLN